MSTDMTWQTKSTNSEQTEQLGEQLGKALRGGEVLELISDLGGGKTTLVRGIARGAGSVNHVASPTFTISKTYDCQSFTIHHFDFYRLQDAGLIAYELADIFDDSRAVIIVEWGGVVEQVLPIDRLRVELSRTADDERQITITYPLSLEYIVKNLRQHL